MLTIVPPRSPAAADLRTLVQAFVRRFGLLDQDETPCGMPLQTSHAHALMILLSAGAPGLHQAELARQLGIDKSNASRLVRQLAARRQVVVNATPDEDARLKRVRLTAKGARVAASVEQSSRRRFAGLLHAIEPRHRRAVIDGLVYLNRALERNRT